MKEFKSVKEKVKQILTDNFATRNDDKYLIWKYWKMEKGIEHSDLMVINYIDYCNLTPESTITRARRQLQQMHPKLRGSMYNVRKNIKEPEARQEVTESKWVDIGQRNIGYT